MHQIKQLLRKPSHLRSLWDSTIWSIRGELDHIKDAKFEDEKTVRETLATIDDHVAGLRELLNFFHTHKQENNG